MVLLGIPSHVLPNTKPLKETLERKIQDQTHTLLLITPSSNLSATQRDNHIQFQTMSTT